MSAFRNAASSLVSHSVGNILYRIASLLIIARYAEAIGPPQFGELEKLLALSLLLIPVVSIQIPDAAISLLTKSRKSASVSAAAMLFLASMAFVLVMGGLMLSGLMNVYVGSALTAHVVTTIVWQLLRNLLRSQGYFDRLVVCETIQAVTLMASGFLMLHLSKNYSGALVAVAIANVSAIGFLAVSVPWSKGGYQLEDISLDACKSILGVAKKLLPNVLLWWVIEVSDRWVLSFYLGNSEVGVYSAGARVAGMGMMVVLLIYQSWQVFGIRALHEEALASGFFKDTFDWYASGVSLVFSLLLVVMGPLSVFLFGSEFSTSSKFAAGLVPALFLSSLSYFFGIVYFSAEHAVAAWKSALAGLVASVAINVLLIPVLGAVAAPIALFAAFSVVLFIRYQEAKEDLGVELNFRNFICPFAILALQCYAAARREPPLVVMAGTLALLLINHKAIRLIASEVLILIRSR